MKITIVHNRYVHPGGEDSVVLSEIEMLRKYGHEVSLYEADNAEIQKMPLWSKLHFSFTDFLGSPLVYKDFLQFLQQDRPDIVHIHNSFYMLGPSIYLVAHDLGIPIIQTLHNYRFLCPNALFFRDGHNCEECVEKGSFLPAIKHRCWQGSFFKTVQLSQLLMHYKQLGVFNKIDQFIVTSQFSLSRYEKAGWDVSKFAVKPNFLEFVNEVKEYQNEFALYVGTLQPYKGIKTLLDAWEELDFPLKIVGSGPLENYVKQRISTLKNVEYLGQKSFEDVNSLIDKAGFLVLPSECYENFPRVIVEAFAQAKPVIASRMGAMAELVRDGETGLHFKAGNSVQLANQVKRLINDCELAKDMGINARKIFENTYTMEKNYQQLINIYQSVRKDYE